MRPLTWIFSAVLATLATLPPRALPAMAAEAEAAAIAITDAWIRPPALPGRPAALYFTLSNAGAADSLIGVSTAAAGRAELHQHVRDRGVMSMKKMPAVAVPAHGTLAFAPMGYHVMLFKPGPGVVPGAKIPATLTFEKAGPVTVEAVVKTLRGE